MRNRRKNVVLILALFIVLAVFVGVKAINSVMPDEDYEDAVKLFKTEQYDEACARVQLAIKKNGEKADYYILYGMSLIGCADYENARKQFLHVVQNKDNKLSREINKQAYRGIALTYYESGVYDQAKAYFQLSLDTDAFDEMDSDLKAYVAECEMYLGEYGEAVKSFSNLIDNKDGDKEAIISYYMGRANAYMITGEYLKAADDYEQALDRNKECYPAYVGKYLALYNTHDENAANEFLKNSIEMLQKKEKDYYYLAILEYYNNNYNTALDIFVDEKDNGNKEADYYIGLIKQSQGFYEKALSHYEEYIAAVPSGKTAEFCNQVGGCYMALEDYEQAAEYFETGALLSGGNLKQEVLRNRIIAYEKLGEYNKAAEYAEEYIEQYDDPEMITEYKFIQTRI